MFMPSFVTVSIPESTSGLFFSIFLDALNFFLGCAFTLALAAIGKGSKYIVTLGSVRNCKTCASRGGAVPPMAATTWPAKAFPISVHNCLSALTTCSIDIRPVTWWRRSVHCGQQLGDPLRLTLPAAQSDLVQCQGPSLQTPLQLKG